jgi:hypothetical protein
MNAYKELLEELQEGETVQAIVFGEYGWGGYCEIEGGVPEEKQGVVLTLEDAKPFMQTWSFDGDFGAPECYATNIWTNRRIFWVTEYDGSTTLDSASRNPTAGKPNMPGG